MWVPAQVAHDLSPYALPIIANLSPSKNPNWLSVKWNNLTFRNPVGIAGGVDKTGESLLAWQKLGCGFLEVGTVTPLPQSANPGKILDRDIALHALWNQMGFPNSGVENLKNRLQKIKHQLQVPLFINIGKNRETNLDEAFKDYVTGLNSLNSFADAFVINISSPNTKDLRSLLAKESLSRFLAPIVATKIEKPILLKLSPDMDEADIDNALQVSLDYKIDGWILTNTTLARPVGCKFPPQGGLSGKPLDDKSKLVLQKVISKLGQQRRGKLIISVGGVDSYVNILERLELGADLVQVYTALVYQGPLFFNKLSEFHFSK